MRILSFCSVKRNVSYSLLMLFTIAFLASCKKNDVPVQAPVISYSQKIISVAVDVPMTAIKPDSTGGSIAEYMVSPSLPKGISLNKFNGTISGTPSDTLLPTKFVVMATGPGGVGRDTLTLSVGTVAFNYGNNPNYTFTNGDAALITTPLTPSVLAGTFVRFMITSPYPDSLGFWTGLTFDPATGKFSGTANKLTSSTASPVAKFFTVTGITANNKAASATVSFTVNDVAPTFYYAFKGSLVTNTNYVDSSSAVVPGNVPTPITSTSTGSTIKAYRLASGSPALPAGLSLDSTNGRIYGNPTTAGTTNVIIAAFSAGGANPKTFTVPVVITAAIQVPMISYAMVLTNRSIPANGGNTITVTDTLASSIPSNTLIYLTNNTALSAVGENQGAMSGTSLSFIATTTQGQISSYGALTPALTGLTVAASTGAINSAVPKVTAASGTSTIALNNAISGGTAGSYTVNYQSNAPYVTYNSSAGAIGSTKFCATRSFGTYGGAYFFIKGRAIDAAPNGTDSCYYTAAQLSPSATTATSYSIYPSQLLPGLSFNTTTGALSGTPTISTSFSGYNFITYTIVGRKTDGSYTMCQILVKVFDNVSDYKSLSIYP